MSVYLDTSVLVPLFLPDTFIARTRAFMSAGPSGLIVSDFASAEFASVVGIRMRMKMSSEAQAREAFHNFDAWVSQKATSVAMKDIHLREAGALLRRLDLSLRAPDAIHLAIARELGADLATFDKVLADAARVRGVSVAAL